MDEETLKQQIHELKLALKTSKSLQQDANIENERLVIELKNRDEQIVATKKSHDDEIRVIKEELFNSTNVYETEKLALQGQIEEYKAQLDNAKLEKHVKSDSSDLDELINEIKDEKQKNLKLSTEVDELKDEIGELKAEKHRTDQKLTELSRMYEETRESLDIKKAYLDEIQNALKECQEEKALLSSKLDILTTGPATSIERGNSLFKEVEDNRKKMANAYKILKTKYLRVQDTLMGKNQEIARLKTQIVSLKNVELTFGEDDQKSQNKYIDSCEKRIKELESFVHMLEKRKESPEIVTLSDNNYLQLQWVHTIVDGARSEARKTIADCQKMSFDSYEKASALLRAEMELKNLKIEVIRKDGRIEELESKVSQLQGELKENIPTPHVAVDVLSVSKSSNKTVRFVDDSALEETCLDTK